MIINTLGATYQLDHCNLESMIIMYVTDIIQLGCEYTGFL